MSTISTTRRTVNSNTVVTFVIALAAILAFAVVLPAVMSKAAIIPVTGNQNAYAEFLRGEKEIFASSIGSSNALSAYRLGEKEIVNTAESAWTTYILGEKGNK